MSRFSPSPTISPRVRAMRVVRMFFSVKPVITWLTVAPPSNSIVTVWWSGTSLSV